MTLELPGPTLDYDVVDVFTDSAFAGNALAVVHGADGLADGQLHALAQEFALSETAFPLPATDPAADYRLRIFTPLTELPFAGHPSVGAAWVLRARGLLDAGERVQECGAGLVGVRLAGADDGAAGDGAVTLESTHLAPGPALDPAAVAAALRVDRADLDPLAMPGTASSGIGFGFALVRAGLVDRLTPDLAAVAALRDAAGTAVPDLSVGEVRRTDDGGLLVHTRVFAPGVGVGEDPATGSAALALGVWLVDAGLVGAEGTTAYTVRQGVAMGRPSTLACRVTAEHGRAVQVQVTGRVAPVATGRIRVPPRRP